MSGSFVIPSMRYRDAPAAIEWLCSTLGFSRHAVYEGPENTIAHAELTLGSGMVMLGSASNESPYPKHMAHPDEIGSRVTSPMYLIVPDCTPIYAQVQAAGADILQELRNMDYGGQAFTVCDPEGYLWSFGEYDPWAPQAASTGEAA